MLRNLVRNQEAHYRGTGRTRHQYQSSGPPGQWQQASTPPALGHERKLLEARHAAMQHAALVSSRLPACSPNLRSLTRDEDDRAPLPWGLPVLVLVLQPACVEWHRVRCQRHDGRRPPGPWRTRVRQVSKYVMYDSSSLQVAASGRESSALSSSSDARLASRTSFAGDAVRCGTYA